MEAGWAAALHTRCVAAAWPAAAAMLLWQRRLRLPQLPRRHGCIRSSGLRLRDELWLLLAVGLMRWTC